MRKPLFLLAILSLFAVLSVGCGGVKPGVADGPDQPKPEMTPEQQATEQDIARQAKRAN